MDKIDILEKKIRQAAEQLVDLKEENKKLQANMKFIETENKKAGQLIRENDILQDERKQVASRVEKVLKRINSLNV